MDTQAVLTRRQSSVLVVTLNRPKALNGMNAAMRAALLEALRGAAADEAVRAVVIIGSGRSFCAGADVKEFGSYFEPDAPKAAVDFIQDCMRDQYNPTISTIAEMGKPVITAVNGICAGGGVGLALSGDVVLCARSATFHQPFVTDLSIIPDLGGTWFLPNIIGRNRALAWVLTGEPVDAEQARNWGMVWRVVDAAALEASAIELAELLSHHSPEAVSAFKKSVQLARNNSLQDQLEFERKTQKQLTGLGGFEEGVKRFCGKASKE